MSERYPWLLTRGLYVVDEDDEGNEHVLSGPWFTDEEAEADRATWSDVEGRIAIVGWIPAKNVFWESPETLARAGASVSSR